MIKVAHGGFEVTIVHNAVQTHFKTALSSRNQPHAFNIHTFFLRPAVAGKVVVKVQEKSLGSSVSTTLATLSQKGKEIAMAFVSYVQG